MDAVTRTTRYDCPGCGWPCDPAAVLCWSCRDGDHPLCVPLAGPTIVLPTERMDADGLAAKRLAEPVQSEPEDAILVT